jgi:hypothetical protein
MKRSRLIRVAIASLVTLPLLRATQPALRRNLKRETTPVVPVSLETTTLACFAQPVTLTPAGIKKFLNQTYNHHDYALDFLPNNFSHLLQFLRKGKESHQKRAYAQSVFRLFANKLKSTNYVNAYAFSAVLQELPPLLSNHFIVTPPTKNTAMMQTQVNEMLYSRFLSQFQSFKNDPVQFLDTLSQDIVSTLEQQEISQPTDPTSIEELRKTTLMFLEVALSKLIWNPKESDDTWRSIKNLARDLSGLFEHHIIVDQDDLNDLFRTLIERYCLFIDIASNDLPLEFFSMVKQDISTQSLALLDLEEEEDVESKSERLMRALTQAEQQLLFKAKKART